MHKPVRKILSAAILGIMAANSAQAGGFSLYTEASPAAIGNYAAGIAAEASDASIGWYNPAGLPLLKHEEVVAGGIGVFPDAEITGTSTFTTVIAPGIAPSYVQHFTGLEYGKNAFVPSLHYARPLGENAAFGLSFISPFGLSTEYSRTDPVRYAATFTELLTMNVSPEIGGKVTEHLSVGAGIDLQYARVKFNQVLGSPATLAAVNMDPFLLDSPSYNRGKSFGVGFHAGALVMFNDEHSRLGLNYQSKMHHRFHGYSRLTGRLASPGLDDHDAVYWSNDLSSNSIELPEIITLSGYHDVNPKIALLGSVVFTGWHVIRTLQLNNVAGFAPGVGQTKLNSTSTENYRNAWRFALGANYHATDKVMLRVGGGYDQTPTRDEFRTARLPDSDRYALSVGGHYQYKPNLGVDVGYTYLWGETAIINKTTATGATSTYNVNARGDAHSSLVGAQVVWLMDYTVAPTK